jgi:hypothetical protein
MAEWVEEESFGSFLCFRLREREGSKHAFPDFSCFPSLFKNSFKFGTYTAVFAARILVWVFTGFLCIVLSWFNQVCWAFSQDWDLLDFCCWYKPNKNAVKKPNKINSGGACRISEMQWR